MRGLFWVLHPTSMSSNCLHHSLIRSLLKADDSHGACATTTAIRSVVAVISTARTLGVTWTGCTASGGIHGE
eukprot:1804175-Alexandrium_andersonii.AAC.1